jgi:hypothetical protein
LTVGVATDSVDAGAVAQGVLEDLASMHNLVI